MASLPSTNPLPEANVEVLSPTAASSAEKHSYAQILKSSALIGGASALNIAIGIVRTKAMAMLLGPGGFGLASLYNSISDLTLSIAGLGVNSSGVRQIAEAAGSGDTERIARTAAVLRRTSIFLGVVGALLLIAFSKQVSILTFGSSKHALAICLLSVAVSFRLISAGQQALIQGMRRIADLAKMNVLGAFFGMLISIPLVYVFRQRGIVPALIAVAGMMIVTSWWYSRKIEAVPPAISISEVLGEATPLLKLGFAFMSSGLMTMGVAYFVRVTVLSRVGLEAAGFYQAAWTLGGLYVGFILQAMGADFYPRLTAAAHDNPVCNRLVNEQTRVGLLLGGPGVIATITFAPIVISLFYTAKFGASVGILRWICLGTILQVITWPMGFIIIAKGRRNLFFFSELAWTAVSIVLATACIRRYGATGAGMAFFGSYVFHGLMTYPMVHWLSGFRWSAENRKAGLLFLALIGSTFYGFARLPLAYGIAIGTIALLIACVFSWRAIISLVSCDLLPTRLRKMLIFLRVVPAVRS